ncbi:unnamed protein product [Linum trigynum]|uniref:Uncharacterized protein n=1 Tax=Linum trigynum TaxID=586398 RepID=A0AAV2GVK6_9ROSI
MWAPETQNHERKKPKIPKPNRRAQQFNHTTTAHGTISKRCRLVLIPSPHWALVHESDKDQEEETESK